MKKFQGDLTELRQRIAATGREGEWVENEHSYQFRCADGAILNWYPKTATVQYQGDKNARGSLERALAEQVAGGYRPVGTSSKVNEKAPIKAKVFVVHGHDQTAREQLELVLHKLGLDPFVLANTGGDGLTIIEALEREIGDGDGKARFGIVLLTPDDVGYAKLAGPENAEPRARQNVVLEMGMLLAALGRSNVAILKRGHLEVPSDANGILYIAFNDHVKEVVPRLADRLQHAGFTIDARSIARASS